MQILYCIAEVTWGSHTGDIVLNVEDLILVEIQNSKVAVLKSEIPDKDWNVIGLKCLLKKLRDTDNTVRQPNRNGRRLSCAYRSKR